MKIKFTILFIWVALSLNDASAQGNASLLVFSKTIGYRHASIADGIAALKQMAERNQWQVDFTEDSLVFTAGNLKKYDAVVFLNTHGDILNDRQQTVFENYIRNGGAYVGVHAASATEYEWSWYGDLIGAHFDNHPEVQEGRLHVVKDARHPAVNHLPESWVRTDEWYNFRRPLPDYCNALITLDESSYEGGQMGRNHPISWYHVFDGGRVFYTAMGHTPETYSEELFLEHLEEGIKWTLKVRGNAE